MSLSDVLPIIILLASVAVFIRMTHEPIGHLISLIMKEFRSLLKLEPNEWTVNALAIIVIPLLGVLLILLHEISHILRFVFRGEYSVVEIVILGLIIVIAETATAVYSIRYCTRRR